MNRIRITLKYGLGRSLIEELPRGTTVGQLKTPSVKAALGLPENVHATQNGVRLDNGQQLQDGDEILFEQQAAQKAA